MRRFFKLGSFKTIPQENLFKAQTSNFLKFQALIHSKPSKPQKPQHTEFASILTQITEIIGPTPPSLSPLKEEDSHGGLPDTQEAETSCSPSVCRNAKQSAELENINSDVSPIVHKITEIVRAEDAALSMEERLGKEGFVFDSDIVEKVLKRGFKVGGLALRFFNWLKREMGFRHTCQTYNTMIYIAGEAKGFDVVEDLVEEMEKECCPKDIKTWTILISSYGRAKQIGKALVWFERMRKSGCEPDGTVYKVILHALCNVGKAEIALEFYKEMVCKNIEMDIKLYKLLLNCFSRSGNISEVRLVGEDMINISQIPEQKVYSCMLTSFCIARRIREALELLRELKNRNMTLDLENFEILVKGLCRDGKISDALEIVGIMKKKHAIDGKIYEIIIDGYLRRNEVTQAYKMFSNMKEHGHVHSVSIYTRLMQNFFRSNDYDRACRLYDEMLEKAIRPDIVSMTALIAGHIQNNHVSEALKVFETMNEKDIKVTHKSYSVAIKELCKVSKTDEALQLVDKMTGSKMKVGDEIFQFIIFALERRGELEKVDKVKQMWKAFKLFDQETNASVDHQSSFRMTETNPNLRQPNQELNSSQNLQSEVDCQLVQPLQELHSDHDLQEICKILSSPINWTSMQEALEKCTVRFTAELVLEVLRRCQSYGHAALSFFSWVGQQACYSHSSETYNMAIKISGRAKDFKHMRNLYHEMKKRGCLVSSDTWTIMIMQYGRAGLTEIGLRIFEEMQIDGCKPNMSTYKYLIVLLCGKKGRRVDEAIKIFHQMINAGYIPDKELVENYLNCLCEVGKLSDARWCMDALCKNR